MDFNQIVINLPKSSNKEKAPKKKEKLRLGSRSPARWSKKDKDRLKIEKVQRSKSPQPVLQREIQKKEPKAFTSLTKANSLREEKAQKERDINDLLKSDDTSRLVINKKAPKEREINEILKNDDAKVLGISKDGKFNRGELTSNLHKRSSENYLNEGRTILKFDENDEEERQISSRNTGGSESIDQIFGGLKKVKKESQGPRESKPSDSEKKTVQLRRSEPSFEEIEKISAPWMSSSTSKVENPIIRFHNEILDFIEHVGPSKKEQNIRNKSFEKLTSIILESFPHATVKPFGSFVTGLYLRQSDIDVAVIEPTFGTQALISKIAKVLMKHEDYENINVIKSAKVPLVKVVEVSTGINFDISFNKLDGINQVQEIQKALDYYPEMRHMILVLKCFLKQRDLNETYQGGIGSFLLFCLVLTFLREVRKDYLHSDREDEIDRILLSEYIIKFLDYFANFDYFRKQILIGEGGAVVNKYMKAYGFSVISPQDSSHDIGSAVFRVKEVFGIFKNRVHFILNYNFKKGESVLKYLVDGHHL